MNENDNQLWLDPEWKKEHDKIVRHKSGRKFSSANVYEVPRVSVDKDARELIRNWPVELSARKIRILKPFALYADLEPTDLLDFETLSVKNVVITKQDENTVRIGFEIDGKNKSLLLIYHPENSKVEWAFETTRRRI